MYSHFCSSALNIGNKKNVVDFLMKYIVRGADMAPFITFFLFTHDFEMARAQNWKRVDI